MKKILCFVILLMTISLSASAQKVVYKCTGDKVRVRAGASLNAKVLYDEIAGESAYLYKGNFVVGTGKKQNGFIQVTNEKLLETTWGTGWVSAQFLKPAQRCSACGGKGHFSKTCTICKGDGCMECGDTGKAPCQKCWGVGYN
ncbi:MAG: hypothetical protein II293_05545 [Bacteroidaceae bacterium]|nr:hypothetical protein [Bacteroidaceae bacterium]